MIVDVENDLRQSVEPSTVSGVDGGIIVAIPVHVLEETSSVSGLQKWNTWIRAIFMLLVVGFVLGLVVILTVVDSPANNDAPAAGLDRIVERRKLLCGVSNQEPGFSEVYEPSGVRVGMDAEYVSPQYKEPLLWRRSLRSGFVRPH